MAELEFVYRIGYCELTGSCDPNYLMYCDQCHTAAADVLGCRHYNSGKTDPYHIPFGDCIHADFKYKYKGVTTKNYNIDLQEDIYNQHLTCLVVTIGKKSFECVKVTLNGKCIFNVYDNAKGEDLEDE